MGETFEKKKRRLKNLLIRRKKNKKSLYTKQLTNISKPVEDALLYQRKIVKSKNYITLDENLKRYYLNYFVKI